MVSAFFLWFSVILFSCQNHPCVMASMLSLNVVDHGFEPWLGQSKHYKIGVCCFSTDKDNVFK